MLFAAGFAAPVPVERSASETNLFWQVAAKRTVTWVGPQGQKKQALAVSGQQMKDIARASGIPIRYDCQEGTCKTCEAQLSPGGRTKLCVARMPNKDVTIKYNIRF